MGYGYYEINRFNTNRPMKRGYGVQCKCHERGCKEKIDRGLAYLCYRCGWYFCGEHLTMALCNVHDTFIEYDCFAGKSSQVCTRCAAEIINKSHLDECDLCVEALGVEVGE